jgi:hypothetical protein
MKCSTLTLYANTLMSCPNFFEIICNRRHEEEEESRRDGEGERARARERERERERE